MGADRGKKGETGLWDLRQRARETRGWVGWAEGKEVESKRELRMSGVKSVSNYSDTGFLAAQLSSFLGVYILTASVLCVCMLQGESMGHHLVCHLRNLMSSNLSFINTFHVQMSIQGVQHKLS